MTKLFITALLFLTACSVQVPEAPLEPRDSGSDAGPDAQDACAPATCGDVQCGDIDDGCGGTLHCGDYLEGTAQESSKLCDAKRAWVCEATNWADPVSPPPSDGCELVKVPVHITTQGTQVWCCP